MKDLLIVVDMQEGFHSAQSENILPNVLRLVSYFNGEKIFCCFRNIPKSKFEKDLKWKRFQNIKDRSLMKEFPAGCKIFWHSNYTILNKELMKFIKKEKFRSIYLSGVYTDVCILKAAMDAFDNGIKIKVIHDACASLHGLNNHKYTIDSLKHIIGKKNVVSVPKFY